MRVLAIETSCDETAVALVRDNGPLFEVEEHVVASQIATHAQYGGVVPEVAARLHVPVLPKMLEAMTHFERRDIDGVAVTSGPGLSTALRVGIESAKALATSWDVPLIPVDHIEGHVYANFLTDAEQQNTLDVDRMFPALCLIVSGGHTELVLMQEHGMYKLLGQTRDDAAGEAFDKTAKQLGLPYPGGPSIARVAEKGDPAAIAFPRPMIHSGDLDMSFSGLKTAVRVELAKRGVLSEQDVADIAASFQRAAVDVLVAKVGQAVEAHAPESILICGGVSANKALRQAMKETFDASICVHVPAMKYTTDNAAMIGAVGVRALMDGRSAKNLFAIDADPGKVLGGPWKWETYA